MCYGKADTQIWVIITLLLRIAREWEREREAAATQTRWYGNTKQKQKWSHTHSLYTGLLTLYVPSVLWSRSLMSWKFLCSSKGRFSIPGEKRRNWVSLDVLGPTAAFKEQVQNSTQFSLLQTAGLSVTALIIPLSGEVTSASFHN